MEIDPTTFEDLSIFGREGDFSIFHKLNFTTTIGGKEALQRIFQHPLQDRASIISVQEVVGYIAARQKEWTEEITNGTIIMIGEYRRSQLSVSSGKNLLELLLYKTIKSGDLAFIQYSLVHISDLFKGLNQLIGTFRTEGCPSRLLSLLTETGRLIAGDICGEIAATDYNGSVALTRVLRHDYFIRYIFRHKLEELIESYYRLDAWHSMAIAMERYELVFPVFIEEKDSFFKAGKLYHILLPEAVGNDITMGPGANFMFLTGANMSGKSTFIKAIGIAAFLAHLGMGVPAKFMELTIMDGILSNIQVQDNIMLGESYFYNEVQRIKNTIVKISGHKRWLILVDELFKGTNIEDARSCSIAVIKGLSKVRESIFVLSTHLYEIAEDLKELPNLRFWYLESTMKDGVFRFNYRLQEGISNDRLGYLILKREKILEMLEQLDRGN
jgi:DNA mismatch repair protein MutS